MSRIYKVAICVGPSADKEIFAIKPYLESFDSFKEEIFIRKPELKNQPLKIYYTGKPFWKLNCVALYVFNVFISL